MAIETRIRPGLSPEDAVRVAAGRFDIDATAARELPSERDQNFLLETASAGRYVLKLAHAGEDRVVLDFQNRMLEHLGPSEVPVSRVVSAVNGEEIVEVPGDGVAFPTRLLTWLPGTVLARVRPQLPELLWRVGAFLGRVDRALESFSHPAQARRLYWDLQRAGEEIRSRLDGVADPGRRALLEGLTGRHLDRLEPLVPALRTSVIHGDANDHNVLISELDPGARQPDGRPDRRVTGLLDFGDAVHSYTVGDPAIAAAYAMLGKADPLTAAATLVAGYDEIHRLRDEEIAALFPLMILRLCTSVAVSAQQQAREPDLEYLSISETSAWDLLSRFEDEAGDFPHFLFRHACGREPVPGGRKVARWLEEHGGGAASVVGTDAGPVRLASTRVHVFDFSVTSTEFGLEPEPGDAAGWTEAIFRRMPAGIQIGVGRYDEVRPWYAAAGFEAPSEGAPEWRTVHLGIDLFLEAGTPVFAPFDAVVHSVADNDAPLDYGPTVILEHRVGTGEAAPARQEPHGGDAAPDHLVFWTLYGHLSPGVLDALAPGQALGAGEAFARIGDYPRNGNWASHLHFQLLLHPLGSRGDFSGVARPSQRELWKALSPDPNLLLRIDDGAPGAPVVPPPGLGHDEILERRNDHLGPNLSVAYQRPLEIVRGRGRYLYDAAGQPYLDCVNNVPHVGHSHPRVVAAGQRQMGLLNTNTRYLHDTIVEYAERLLALFPESLSRVYFVCTGSEANELALRMARTHTGRDDVVVVEGGYHGNTSTLVDVSHYKFAGPGGQGPPDWVHVTPLPDPYRGRFRAGPEPARAAPGTGGTGTARGPAGAADLGRRYADEVGRVVAEAASRGRPPAAFLAEPLIGCGGQIVPPPGWLAGAYEQVRAAAGVCIADEVQVGFGRVGTHVWAFESQDVVPDIVTLGKPMGNGHPLAAVVTTAGIAGSFDTGMEYFNTFGGNPVSCAIGMAVLDVLEDEGLQANARRVGGHLLHELTALKADHPLIGDVRGLGLYLGVELVADPDTRPPATGMAQRVKERLRDHRILLSTDGPDHNVLKIKPPMVFSEADADRLVDTLDRILTEDEFAARDRIP